MNPILRVEGLERTRGRRTILRGIDFELLPGTVTVLLGANGEGKTTLLRSILGSVRPDAGRITVLAGRPFGRRLDARALRAARQAIGYLPDVPDVPDWMSAGELFRYLAPHYPRWDEALAQRVARQLGVPLEAPIGTLSRGEATRALLAAAMAPAPSLYLFDEPFAALEPASRDEFMSVFLAEARLDQGAALLSTHDLDVAARLADRILLLADGELVVDGSLDGVLAARGEAGNLTGGLRSLFEAVSERRREAARGVSR